MLIELQNLIFAVQLRGQCLKIFRCVFKKLKMHSSCKDCTERLFLLSLSYILLLEASLTVTDGALGSGTLAIALLKDPLFVSSVVESCIALLPSSSPVGVDNPVQNSHRVARVHLRTISPPILLCCVVEGQPDPHCGVDGI
jgi:hypothetical protein